MSENVNKEEISSQNKVENTQTLSDNKKLNRTIKTFSIIFIVVALIWVFILNPYITFKSNEKKLTEAGKRFFETYSQEMPTGERVGEVTLQELYEKGLVDSDFYVPFSLLNKKTCSVTESWVKVKRQDGEYKYYTFLKCGILGSHVDHKGPKIVLNDKEEITVSLGENFKDPGIKSIKDLSDGEIDVKEATIKGEVDTSKVGKYEISYVAFDKLKNRTEVKRTVNVVQELNKTVKKATDNKEYYSGVDPNNYIYFSGMLFRIVDLDDNNVRIVAERDISNVNYDGIDSWLNYYYDHINEESKKLIVKNKYCKMNLDESKLSINKCNNYTKELNVYIPSVIDVNKAQTDEGNYLKPETMSWLADTKDKNSSYLTRNIFYNEYKDRSFVAYNNIYNFGVRPILTIKGDVLITTGNGTEDNPYEIGDFKTAKASDKVNTRQSGEYLEISGKLWQIVDKSDDGATKVIADFSLSKDFNYLKIYYDDELKDHIYNPKIKNNVGYQINNLSSQYIDTKYFVKHLIEVPIYKDNAMYGKEIDTKTYKTTIFAPNMYEMYSADSGSQLLRSYWTINSSKDRNLKYGVSDIGVVMYGELTQTQEFGIRPTAFLDKGCIIVSGKGTKTDPYKIDK